MAMSFSRPDPSSPASVADAGFGTSRRGFDQGEVREFLRMVAAELGRLQERERFLEHELRTALNNPDLSSAKLDDAALTRLVGEETARVLGTARESANEITDKAEGVAGRMLSEAADEARRLREEAEVESTRRRADAAADAEAELDMAKQQGREMVNEARAYRERVLSELARRRELAREQIEQLIHGRDRLMQAFERARLVAVDVVSEMQPLGEPDEYVNLSPTTGPVPVMVANSERPAESPAAEPPDDAAEIADETTEPVDDAAETADEAPDVEPAEISDDAALIETAETAETAEISEHTVDTEISADDTVDTVDTVDTESSEISAEDTVDTVDTEISEISDDVVVDLFARIRAGADAPSSDEEPEATPEQDIAAVDTDTTETETDAAETDPAETDPAETDAAGFVAEPTAFEHRDEDLTPLIVASARKLKRVLADEQNDVLDALRRGDAAHDLDALLPPLSEHAARYAGAIADELAVAAQAGAASVTDGRAAKLRKADAGKAAEAADEVLEQWLVSPLRERLERCVSEGEGENEVITKKVRAAYREWKTQHIDEQLDDVLLCAYGRGLLAGVPDGSTVSWGIDERHGACADCHDNSLAGIVAAGDEFPTGHMFAPAHPGCRCLLLLGDR